MTALLPAPALPPWTKDLSDSAYDFVRVVWPVARKLISGGEIVPVEAVANDDFARTLDIYAGIDAWQIVAAQGQMRGIASRIQWGAKRWDTFTVRCSRDSGAETEYDKRQRCLARPLEGWLYPAYTVQAYVTARRTGLLLSVAAIPTADLFHYLHYCAEEVKVNRTHNAEFKVARWERLLYHGYGIRMWPTPEVADGVEWDNVLDREEADTYP